LVVNRILLVLAGGGVGSVLRYLTALAAVRFVSPTFPFGTLVVNVVGCFFIGFVHSFAMLTARISPDARLFLTTGVLGGLTTYSSFNYEALALVEQTRPTAAALYVLATGFGCVAAGLAGTWSARALAASG
jgi:CrcB protein